MCNAAFFNGLWQFKAERELKISRGAKRIAGCFTVIFPGSAGGSYSQTCSSTPCPAK